MSGHHQNYSRRVLNSRRLKSLCKLRILIEREFSVRLMNDSREIEKRLNSLGGPYEWEDDVRRE
jgi:hypothetical protein